MDRASVEEGFYIDNDGKVGLSWDNDYTLNIDISELVPNTKYTIRIDGSTAKNSQTGQLLDGNGDGTGGDDYVLEITMAEPDLTPATVVSTDPAADSEVEYNLRPVVRIEYSEPLNWNEDRNAHPHGNRRTVSAALLFQRRSSVGQMLLGDSEGGTGRPVG